MVVLVTDQQAVGVAYLDLDAFGGLLRGRAHTEIVTVMSSRSALSVVNRALSSTRCETTHTSPGASTSTMWPMPTAGMLLTVMAGGVSGSSS